TGPPGADALALDQGAAHLGLPRGKDQRQWPAALEHAAAAQALPQGRSGAGAARGAGRGARLGLPADAIWSPFGPRQEETGAMVRKVRWGIVSTADIGMKKVTPGIMKSRHSEVVAIASRNLEKAQDALAALGIANGRAYGSYEELIADPDVDAIYNPLPNHL